MVDTVQLAPQTTGPVAPGAETQAETESHFYGAPKDAPSGQPASSIAPPADGGGDPAGVAGQFTRVDIAVEGDAEPGNLMADVPGLILGKFKDQAALEQAYTELSQRMGAEGAPAAPAEAPVADPGGKIPTPPAPAEGTTGLLSDEALGRYTTEYMANGSLTDASFGELEKAGIPRGLAESHLAGLQALQENRVGAIHKAAGGADEYGQLVQWAQENMTPAQIGSYNRAIESGDQEQAVLAAEGLRARAFGTTAAGKRAPSRRIVGKPAVVGSFEPYDSQDSIVEAIQDPRYATSPKYREQHAQRLRVSKF